MLSVGRGIGYWLVWCCLQVDIEINGEPVDLHMKLGEAGEAFFVLKEEGTEDVSTCRRNLF